MNDPAPTDLHALLDHPEQVAQVPPEQVPPLLATIASEQAQLAALQGALAVRLVVPGSQNSNGAGKAYTLIEAAALLDKSPAWVRRKATAGRVPGAQKVGRSWMFDRVSFDRWRCRREVG